ncbi:hypothetical protein C3L33_22028, partial [Rhododendron williamsianum]
MNGRRAEVISGSGAGGGAGEPILVVEVSAAFQFVPLMARLQLSLLALFSLCLTLFTSVVNNCNYPVWPGLLSNPGVPQPPTTGFLLNPNCDTTLSMPASWAGNMWGRTLCSTDPNTGQFTCVTGWERDLHRPLCSADIDAACPTELQELWNGMVVGCKSACVAFGDPRDCCTGAYSTPATCGPTPYTEFFKSECPQAFSYAFDSAPVTTVRFYTTCFGFREPFKVLCDGTFIHHLLVNRIAPADSALSNILGGAVKVFTTRCVLAELKSLGESYSESLKAAGELITARCDHEKRKSAVACMMEVVGEKNPEHFFLATQDADLREKLQECVKVIRYCKSWNCSSDFVKSYCFQYDRQ